jgi:hypothetical protein
MTGAFVLVTREIFREPLTKVSKAGKDYCAATLRTVDGAEVVYWSVVAFGSAAEELGRLARRGDCLHL